MKTDWANRLRGAGLKATPVRIAILDHLSRGHTLQSVDEIFSSLKKEGIDRVTLYRSIRSFEESGLVISNELGDGVIRYELRETGEHEHHHHHLICRICHSVKLIEKCGIAKIPKFLESYGYENLDHRLDFFGVCPKCQNASKKPA